MDAQSISANQPSSSPTFTSCYVYSSHHLPFPLHQNMSHLSAFFNRAAALLGALAASVLPSNEHEGCVQYPGGVTPLSPASWSMVDRTPSLVESLPPPHPPSPFYPPGPQPSPTWGLTEYEPLVPWVSPIEIWVKTEEVVEVSGKCKVRNWQEDARTWAKEQKDRAQSVNQSRQSSYYRNPSPAASISSSAWSRVFPRTSPPPQLACCSKPLKSKPRYKKQALKIPEVPKMTLEERVALLDHKEWTPQTCSKCGQKNPDHWESECLRYKACYKCGAEGPQGFVRQHTCPIQYDQAQDSPNEVDYDLFWNDGCD